MGINNGLFNNYTITPRNLTQYKAFRGVTDFSQIGQFNQYETGYQFLSVLAIPKYMELLGKEDSTIDAMNKSFKHMLEYEFRGLDGLPDMQADSFTITDGINEQRMINKVTRETSVEVSSQYFEKSGGLITKYSEYFLSGIKDPMTQAKTYHGLIENDKLDPGLENEVFTLLYYVTDNTMLRLERAVLLANCQLTRAETSMYNGSRDNISNVEKTISFQCFPIFGYEVDKAANYLLKNITGVSVTVNDKKNVTYALDKKITREATFDSADYRYGIMQNPNGEDAQNMGAKESGIKALYDAINNA